MNWTRFVLAVVASGVVASFTDWLFMGVLFHDKYLLTPEIWRGKPGQTETKTMLASTAFGLLSCAVFAYLCTMLGDLTAKSTIRLAVLVWLLGPMPVIFINVIWTRMHPNLGISHSLGWLARFIVTAVIVAWLL
jgi:Protein of unknown function (DUF1761)